MSLEYLTKFELSRNATNQPRKFFPLSSMRFHACFTFTPWISLRFPKFFPAIASGYIFTNPLETVHYSCSFAVEPKLRTALLPSGKFPSKKNYGVAKIFFSFCSSFYFILVSLFLLLILLLLLLLLLRWMRTIPVSWITADDVIMSNPSGHHYFNVCSWGGKEVWI